MADIENRRNGIVYLAFGENWCSEARRSIASLRKVSDLPVAVITDIEWSGHPQPDEFVIRPPVHGFASKPTYILDATPFANTLFIDTDTIVVRDPSAVFGLLEHYDIGVRFGGPQLNEEPNLVFHTQCNSGVILFKNNDSVRVVFRLWKEEYAKGLARHPNQADERGLGDQRYLSIAIAKSKARPVHLAEYLNFALFETIVTYSPPVVLHGRLKDMEMLDTEISGSWNTRTDWHPRLWLPNIRGILPAGFRRADPVLALALVLRRVWNDMRRKTQRVFRK